MIGFLKNPSQFPGMANGNDWLADGEIWKIKKKPIKFEVVGFTQNYDWFFKNPIAKTRFTGGTNHNQDLGIHRWIVIGRPKTIDFVIGNLKIRSHFCRWDPTSKCDWFFLCFEHVDFFWCKIICGIILHQIPTLQGFWIQTLQLWWNLLTQTLTGKELRLSSRQELWNIN
jgi:hypothetical protein